MPWCQRGFVRVPTAMVLEITGLESREWLTLGLLAMASMLVVRATFRDGRRGATWLLPVVAAVAVIGVLVLFNLLRPVLLSRVLSPVPLGILAGVTIVAFALAELLFGRVVPAIAAVLRAFRVPDRDAWTVALVVALVPIVVASAGLAWRISWGRPSSLRDAAATVESVETFELPGSPLGIAMVDERSGYVTFGRGMVQRFTLPDQQGAQLDIRPVIEGLEFPRGIAIRGERLYVVEIGGMPCTPAFPICGGRQLDQDVAEGERRILRATRGRITSFSIDSDGGLVDRRILLDGLPVADSEHAVNGLAVGPDGDLYVSIGWPNALRFESFDTTMTPHPEWMGTILQIDPDSGDVQVHARGFRNIYGIAFDDRGVLWGVDNDGPARNGWRAEEVLRIEAGGDYGFPDDGTFGPWSVRRGGPVWTLSTVGSAGFAWADEASRGPGVFIGSCGRLDHLALVDVGGRYDVVNEEGLKPRVDEVAAADGCVTDISGVAPNTLVASVFGFERGTLLRIRFGDAEASAD